MAGCTCAIPPAQQALKFWFKDGPMPAISDSQKLRRIEAILDGDTFEGAASRLNEEEQDLQREYIESRKNSGRPEEEKEDKKEEEKDG